MINVVDYGFLTGSLTLFFENSTRFALTFSDSLTSRIFARIDTAGGDNCNAAFLLALAFAVLGNLLDSSGISQRIFLEISENDFFTPKLQ